MNGGRIRELELRRQALLNKCEEQRLELSYRVAQLKPARQLAAWSRHAGSGSGKSPLALLAGVLGLLFMLRRRRSGMASSVGWVTGLVALASRTTSILRVLAQLRAVYLTLKASRRAQP